MKSAIAENVKQIINTRGLKQYIVAEKAGYPMQTFNNMLNGRKVITDYDVAKIANALNVTPNELFRINKKLVTKQ